MIRINNIDYKYKQNVSSLMMFEEVAQKKYDEMSTFTDTIILYYCVLLTNNKDTFTIEFNDFVEILNNDSDILAELTRQHLLNPLFNEKKK